MHVARIVPMLAVAALVLCHCGTAPVDACNSAKDKARELVETIEKVKGALEEGLPAWPAPSINAMGHYDTAAVAAGHGRCSEAGRHILVMGGNAVDAAIAAMCCSEVMDPQSAGLGGGFFMTIYQREKKQCRVLDAREVAPASATKNMFDQIPKDSTVGWRAVAVPGFLHGIYTAYEKFGSGRVTWADLLEPTIRIMKSGIPISPLFAERLQEEEGHILGADSTLRVFMNKKAGGVFRTGEVMHRPQLLDTYKQLANATDPINLFYRGEIAANILSEFVKGDGRESALIRRDDLVNYKSIIRPVDQNIESTIMAGAKGDVAMRMCGLPPPSSGAVIQSIMRILTKQNIKAPLKTVDANVDYYHKFIEAMKFAYASRSTFGDIDYNKGMLEKAKNITTDAYVSSSKIAKHTFADPKHYGAQFAVPNGDGTAHVSVIDKDGNAVAVTLSINLVLGSKRRSVSQGIIWNNHMDDFSKPSEQNAWGFAPSTANYIEGGKRMQSSMSPTVIWEEASGKPVMAIGATGGSRIISAIGNVAATSLILNENIKTAVDRPRLHNQLTPIRTEYDPGFPKVYVDELTKRKHNMSQWDESTETDVAAVRVHKLGTDKKSMVYAASDWRKGTQAYPAGY